jgi:hypothetical protein
MTALEKLLPTVGNKTQSIFVAAELNATNDSQPLW